MEKQHFNQMAKEEVDQLLYAQKNTLREMRFKVAQGQLKNIRLIRKVRKTIARILTHRAL